MLTQITVSWQAKPTRRKWLITAGVATLALVFLLTAYLLLNRNNNVVTPGIGAGEEEKKEEVLVAHPINGIMTPQSVVKSWQDRYPIGVMIENLNITRPQTGLSRADIVYEALTEGEITRFMGIYLSESTDLGPVRSARLPFMHWLLEYDAAYAHVGGSAEALDQIGPLKIKNMDQGFIGAPTFERINNRGLSLEHTMFSSSDRLWSKAKDLGFSGWSFPSWKFKEDEVREKRPTTQALTIKFTGNPQYVVRWNYDPETNLYSRENGGLPHLDAATNEVITAKNVIVQFVKTTFKEVTPGKMGRGMETIGGGEVRIFRDGISVSGTWEKPTPQSRTKFLDETGTEIELNRGKIWVEVNPTDTPIEYN